MKLYELSTELAKINDELIDLQGEITEQLETRLDALNLQLEEKASGIRKWYAKIETDGMALDAEIARLEKIRKTNTNLQERLKAYVKKNMEAAGLKKIETQIGVFTIAKNPTSLEIVPEAVPDDFKTTIPEHREITGDDKKRIKQALEEGYEVPGAKLITDRTHLKIK